MAANEVYIDDTLCNGCNICVEFCPKDVLVMKDGYPEVVNIENCTLCQLCELRCPDFAIEVYEG